MSQWFDSHAHLDYEYPFTQDEYIERAKAVGVGKIISVGAARTNWAAVQELANRRSEIYFSVGIHPHDAKDYGPDVAAEMREFAKDPRCLAIGEIGLDYHYDHSPREIQQAACRDQLTLARELLKPVIIHSRDGEEDLLNLLKEHCSLWEATPELPHPGVIHCFSGTVAFARACLDLGFCISFSGIVTFKKAEDVQTTAAMVPLDRILVETDSPYLAPVPYRGKSNESAYMIATCQKIAEIRGIDLDTLSRATFDNTCRLFGIPRPQ